MTWNSIPQHLITEMNQILEDLRNHDVATYNHCVRVSQMSRFLAEVAGLNQYNLLLSQFAGLLHDVGKLKIPLEVLNKPGKLTDEEYELVKHHSLFSAELLEPLEESPFFREVQLAVLHHHERVDGKGYPFGLENEQIPYVSRIILIVDTVDAMTQNRAYRKGLPMPVVYQELAKFAGTQFDAHLVELYIDAHKKLMSDQIKAPVITLPQRIKVA